MDIVFAPQRMDADLSASKNGETLIINGKSFDFSVVPDGSIAPPEAFDGPLVVEARRVNGVLTVTLLLPLGASPVEAAAFPTPLLNVPDGEIAVPGRMA